MRLHTPTIILMALAAPGGLAAEWPAREYLEADGWTIGFSPADRPIAEQVAKAVPDYAKRLASLGDLKLELGREKFSANAGDLAGSAASALGLPARAADLRAEFERGAAVLNELDAALRGALILHAIELWRSAEVIERMQAGERLAGFTWDPKAQRPNVDFAFNWSVSNDDFKLTKTIVAPPAIFLKVERPDDRSAATAALKDLDNWANVVEQVQGKMRPLAVRTIGAVAITRVLKRELPNDPATVWVREGLTALAWREVVKASVPAKAADKYAVLIAQIPVGKVGDKPIRLESWPEKDAELHQTIARQVFINIAEADGPNALAKLLGSFWQLPVEQRTSANLRRLYREQTNQGIEARAPRRSLGPVEK